MVLEVKESNIRIDKYISENIESITRNYVQILIEEGNILVNEKQIKPSYKVCFGDKIEINIPEKKELEIIPQDIPINIVYEDKDVIVVNKEKGMVVHPANGNEDNTLVNAILAHCKDSLSGINGIIRPGIVHRIDKDTSGILVIAKNDETHNNLAEQFKNHSINRIYIALVRGVLPNDEGTIDMPIARSKKDRKKMAADINGKRAVTHFKVIERFDKYTLVELKLETGRTHQIRVHMSQIGYPLIGDTVYSNGKNPFGIVGQMLHAKILGFIHPTSKEYIEFDSNLPDEFNKVLDILRKENNYETN
ncbi:MAG: RluA family pseudouridine synthase [Clostridiales bacterium]|nr:RluA family pseudouridine synthase [Clostridiales bacterium]